MKHDSETKDMKAPDAAAPAPLLEILRKIAGTYRHSNPDATSEDVAGRLREWFKTEGREVDEAAISATLEG